MTDVAHRAETPSAIAIGELEMNKMLVAVFDNETLAAEGLSALKALHKDGDISLYGTAVLAKDAAGKVSTKQIGEQGATGTAFGMLVGSMVGLLAGPVGLAVGASLGGLTGLITDLNKSGIDVQFADDVASAMSPGRVAILADIEETWSAPVDGRLSKIGGMVFRRQRNEVVEDQLARESAAFKAEMTQIRQEWAEARAEDKAAIQTQIDEAKKKATVLLDQTKARIEHVRRETDEKITALEAQLHDASDRHKAKLEKRIAELKADLAARDAKLDEARRLTREALDF